MASNASRQKLAITAVTGSEQQQYRFVITRMSHLLVLMQKAPAQSDEAS
jgi:hypothetical protein